MAMNETVTAQEVAERLDVSLPLACEMIRERQIPGVLRAEKPYRVSRSAFERWLGEGE